MLHHLRHALCCKLHGQDVRVIYMSTFSINPVFLLVCCLCAFLLMYFLCFPQVECVCLLIDDIHRQVCSISFIRFIFTFLIFRCRIRFTILNDILYCPSFLRFFSLTQLCFTLQHLRHALCCRLRGQAARVIHTPIFSINPVLLFAGFPCILLLLYFQCSAQVECVCLLTNDIHRQVCTL